MELVYNFFYTNKIREMKNRKVIVTKEQINTGLVIEIDSSLVASGNYDSSNLLETKILYPNYVYLDNSSGVDLSWNIISNEKEYNDYLRYPNQFALIPLKSSKVLQSIDRNPKCYKFILQKNSVSSALRDIEVYFVNYN